MNIALEFVQCSLDEIKELLNGGTLTVYSVARPITADRPVDRSGVLATFTFASPAFGEAVEWLREPRFRCKSGSGKHVGTPGFARARKADGTVIGDFSAGPDDREIKFSEMSCSQGAPVTLDQVQIHAGGRMAREAGILRYPAAFRFPLPRNP